MFFNAFHLGSIKVALLNSDQVAVGLD